MHPTFTSGNTASCQDVIETAWDVTYVQAAAAQLCLPSTFFILAISSLGLNLPFEQ